MESSNFDDLALYPLPEMEDPEGGSVNKRTRGRTGVEELDIIDPMIRRGVAVTINNGIHLIEFSPDA